MKGGDAPRGYTVVEVMIVLAITGVMFLIAANLINGKQQSAAFNQGVNVMQARLQSTIEEVKDGSYSDQNVHCSLVGASLNFDNTVITQQGSNASCVFLGKFVNFEGGANSSNYQIFTLADTQSDPTGQYITPVVNGVNLTTSDTIPQGLNFVCESVSAAQCSGSSTQYGIGFVQGGGGFAYYAAPTGYQTIDMVYAPAVTSAATVSQLSGASSYTATSQAYICLSDGGSRKATLIIGSDNSSDLSVDAQMGGNSHCP